MLAKGFNAKVVAYDPYPSNLAQEYGVSYVDTLDELLVQSNIISLHCPLNVDLSLLVFCSGVVVVKLAVLLGMARSVTTNYKLKKFFISPPSLLRSFSRLNSSGANMNWLASVLAIVSSDTEPPSSLHLIPRSISSMLVRTPTVLFCKAGVIGGRLGAFFSGKLGSRE